MISLKYYFSKFLKKIRGSAIKNSQIAKSAKIESGCNIVNLIMGKHSFCGYDCEIVNCEIGSFCSIANNVIIGGPMHPMNWVSMSPVFYKGRDSVKAKFSTHELPPAKKTIIGHDVWIGQYALIKQGVHIGTGAVRGMGSVVTKDVEPYSIVAGSPARELRKRFDEVTINKLLKSKWWEYDDDQLGKYSAYFTDPSEFIKLRGL
jgi:acetyltransferase-like isoleucine patch superfamily enzyme